MRWQHSKIFYLEQWAALFLGMACIAAFLWILLDGPQAFSSGDRSAPAAQLLPTLEWLLTIALALVGTALTRFAFYTPPQEGAELSAAPRESRPAEGPLSAGSNKSDLVVASKDKS